MWKYSVKLWKDNLADDSDENYPDEKPLSTKLILEVHQVLRRNIQQLDDFDVFN